MAVKGRTMRGRYNLRNPQKYVGNPNNVVFRSSWECRMFTFLDNSSAVVNWCSEEFSIPYISPFDKKVHQYFPDLFVIFVDKDGKHHKQIIEIKPMKETVLTENSSPHDKHMWVLNQAKWQAARAFAASKGATFRVATEIELFGAKEPPKKRRAARKKKVTK